jgi:hypothetical protein
MSGVVTAVTPGKTMALVSEWSIAEQLALVEAVQQ